MMEDENFEAQTDEADDTEFLHRVIEDAGRWAFGIIFAELWVLDDTGTQLFRPDWGWWINQYADNEGHLSRLTNKSLPDYISADPVMPGIGLAGYLWAQANRDHRSEPSVPTKRSSFFRMNEVAEKQVPPSSKLTWCEVKPLANDPLQAYDERTQYLAKNGGVGLAAGVTFRKGGTRGIVVYMARDTVDLKHLTDSTNEDFLRRATSVIGSAYAMRRARMAAVRKRKEHINQCWRNLRLKLDAIRFTGLDLREVVYREQQKKTKDHHHHIPHSIPEALKEMDEIISEVDDELHKVPAYFKRKIEQETKKFKGANNKPPPVFGWYASFFTFMGSFLTLAMLGNVTNAMVESFGPDYALVMPPFGALVALHYGLTAAPACQPLNTLGGQAVSLVIGHLIGTYLEVDLWLRQALATALAIGIMVKVGFIHPPAAAACVVFSSGKMSWIQVGMMLFGNLLAVLSSTLINNWDQRRQYPTFWGFRPINDYISSVKGKK